VNLVFSVWTDLEETFAEPWGLVAVGDCKRGPIGKEESSKTEKDESSGRQSGDGPGRLESISVHLLDS
jgi:hypothetical protein